MRLQLARPGQVIWTADGGASSRAEKTYDTRLGFWVADLSVQRLRQGTVVQWTLRHADGTWDAEDYQFRIVPKGLRPA